MELSEQEIIRRNSLQELISLGIDPYPAEGFEVNVTIKEIMENFPKDHTLYQEVSIAGRIMNRRIMGAASFAEIQDSTGRMQVYVKRDDICPGEDKTMYNIVFKRLLDIGDIIGVRGYVFITQMGEITIELGLHCESFNAGLLHEPWEVRTGQGDPYRVFTPFW